MLRDSLLADLVPVNDYPTPQSFGQGSGALEGLVTGVELLSEMEDRTEAMLLYDMQVEQTGGARVAEHFTIAHGRIVRLRQIPRHRRGTLEGLAGWWTRHIGGVFALSGTSTSPASCGFATPA